jgi:hypothetical protein
MLMQLIAGITLLVISGYLWVLVWQQRKHEKNRK